jgi:AcrR family transcriptional regulator
MNTQERILFAAKHAFLKYGYNQTTLKGIAKYSDTSPSKIRYYYGSKKNIHEVVFSLYVEMLIDYLKNCDPIDMDLDFEQRNIEYPEMYEIAWFLANEFRTNSEQVYRILNKNSALRDEFHNVHNNNELKEKFGNLIRVNVGVIILRNFLMITKARDLTA